MGLSGRDYMQPERAGPGLRGWWAFLGVGDRIILLNVLVFLLWHLLPEELMDEHFMVSWSGVFEHGRVWTTITSAFSQQGLYHLLWNMLYLHFFALELEQIYGRRNFLLLYLYSAVVSSLAHCAWSHNWGLDVPCLGASGSVMAVVVVAAIFFPTRTITLWWIPLPLWLLASLKLLGDFSGLMGVNDGTAHAAHLGGAAAGAVFWALDLRLFASPGQQESLETDGPGLLARLARAFHRLFQRRPAPAGRIIKLRTVDAGAARADVDLPPVDAETARVDDLLRKIAREGMASLTPDELAYLKAASERRRK